LSVSLGYAAAVAAGLAKLGTGTLNGGKGIFVLCPFAVDPIVAPATYAELAVVIDVAVVEVLKKTRTLRAVVLASIATMDKLSITAPSFDEQSTSKEKPAGAGVLKFVAAVNAAVPPTVANECIGLSTNKGILFELLVAI
jgi:hypothetical protein